MIFFRSLFLFCCCLGLSLPLFAQTHSKFFADTHPTVNLDSLIRWLETNPKPTLERLKNLIKAERTYFFLYPDKMGMNLNEIKQLSSRFHHPTGQAAHHYLTGRMMLRDEMRVSAFKEFQIAYKNFKQLKDTSGIIHAASGLISTIYAIDGEKIGERELATTLLAESDSLLYLHPNSHDYLVLVLARCFHMRGAEKPNFKSLIAYTSNVLKFIESSREYSYSWIDMKNQVAIGYLYSNNYATSYKLYQYILAKLSTDQYYQRVKLMYNLSLSAMMLNRFKERLSICLAARHLYDKFKTKRPQTLYGLYWSLNEEYERLKDTKKAKLYLDSSIVVYGQIKTFQRSEELINLQMRYHALEQQTKIAQLQLRQASSENRYRLILIISGMLIVVILIFVVVWFRIRILNTQLKSLSASREHFLAILAHDLRRPISAFHGMADMVNFSLKEGDFAAIEALSRSIDKSGAQIQQLLDNVVTWALSQRTELPYDPVVFSLRKQILHTAEIYQTIYAQKHPSFEVLVPETLEVFMDVNAFELVIRNLIDNALKASDRQVHVKISAQWNSQKYIKINFEDNSGGMTLQKVITIQQVFDNPKYAKIRENGIGMGIVMIGRFINRNRGRILITSTLGKGTSYTLYLPNIPKNHIIQ